MGDMEGWRNGKGAGGGVPFVPKVRQNAILLGCGLVGR